jgi:hypothetical protein
VSVNMSVNLSVNVTVKPTVFVKPTGFSNAVEICLADSNRCPVGPSVNIYESQTILQTKIHRHHRHHRYHRHREKGSITGLKVSSDT